MTALPASTAFTDSAVTEGGFKTAISDQRAYLAGLLGTTGTIATGQSTLKTLCSAANARTTAYTLVAADRGKVIYCTGTGGWTLTLPVTTTTDMGTGWACAVRNSSTGSITLARSSTDTIDGATSVILPAGSSCILFISAGGAWVTIGKGSANATLSTAGIVELATVIEAVEGTSTELVVTPAGALGVKKASNFTATTSTTGASTMEITTIPIWAYKMTLGFKSLSHTWDPLDIYLDLGDAGGFETSTNVLISDISASASADGLITLVRVVNAQWAYSGAYSTGSSAVAVAGLISTTQATSQIRVRINSGTFDSGTLTVYWE